MLVSAHLAQRCAAALLTAVPSTRASARLVATASRDRCSALVPIAPDSEELEATAIVNVLRRAGWDVTLASVGVKAGAPVTCARGQRLLADETLADAKARAYDIVVIPGGMPGASNLAADGDVMETLRRQKEKGGWYAAICAAPAVVFAQGSDPDLLPPRATCHPAFTQVLEEAGCAADALTDRVVVDAARKCVTSRGPGTAIEFALKLVEVVEGSEAAEKVAAPMVVR